MYIKRLLEKNLKEAIRYFPAVFVGGPRRSGKTTLVKKILKNYRYVLLDELDIRAFANDDPKGFLDVYSPPVIIDEIQNAPHLLSYIKARIDNYSKAGQWIITGSQQWSLMKGISETLAGRIAILHLYPFTLTEILKIRKNQPSDLMQLINYFQKETKIPSTNLTVEKWILNGGYPEIVFGKKNLIKRMWFSSYLQTYIDRDIRGNIREINLRDFERFIRLLAARTSQQINASNLAGEVGVTVPTIKSWLTLLEASGIIFFLMPYYKNFGKRIIKMPKCYFMDTGLVCYLTGVSDLNSLLYNPLAGALFETACVSQMYKRLSILGEEKSMYYFRSTDGLEVDIILESRGNCFPFEIKLSATINQQHLRGINKWIELNDSQQKKGFVISLAKEIINVSTNIKNINYLLL